ncbi:DUF4439 domain-containing protein [Kineococcus sp. SYSU DK003]|uniref:DUF4439 domain-containing protein n=1 Tax=Kineococcus sp. SYSU DK003 TaxID=3383124 RepID=UPI003D7DA60E
MPRSPHPSRRGLLTLLAGAPLVAGGLSSCGVRWVSGTEPTPEPVRGPDDEAREAAVAEARALLHLLEPAAAGPAPLQAVAAQGVQVCRAHLTALGDEASGGTTATAAAPDAQAVVDRLTAAAGAAFTTAARSTAGEGLSGGVARLLASIAASRAVLAQVVATATGAVAGPVAGEAPQATTTPSAAPTSSAGADPEAASRPATVALQAALGGEHAAVHGYALVVARLADPRRTEAAGDLAAHRVARDDLADLLTARGVPPEQAAPGYDVQAPTADAAIALAAAMEDRLAGLYADVVAASAADREPAARALLAAARGARRWGSVVLSFPGMAELSEDGSPAPTASTTP